MRTWIRTIGCLAALTAPVAAQSPSPLLRLTLGGGAATDLRGVRSGAYQAVPSVGFFPDPNLRISLAARGTRFSSREWAIAGAASVEGRIPLGSLLALTFTTSGDVTRASYRSTYLQAEGIPALELRAGAITAWGGARAAAARVRQEGGGSAVPLPGPVTATTVERSTIGPAFGAAFTLRGFGPAEEARITYREEHGRPAGIAVIDRTAGMLVTKGRLGLSASLGARESPGENRLFGSVRAAVTLARGIAIYAGAESYPSNPLLAVPGGRSISAGLALSSGGRGAAPAPRTWYGPRPAGVAPPAPGRIRLAIKARGASRVELAGDWNQWRPVPLTRTSNGVWYVDLEIAPGEYRYAFRIDGTSWDVPKGVAAVNDGFGGRSAWLSVRKPERTSD